EAANRAKCQNNLKQLGLAAVNYHDTYEGFPTAQAWAAGTNGGTWCILLLPYLEQQALYQALYQQTVILGSTSGGLGSPFATPLSVLVCPSDSGLPPLAVVQMPGTSNYNAVTSYRANTSGLFDTNFGVGDYDGVVVAFLTTSVEKNPGVRITDIT